MSVHAPMMTATFIQNVSLAPAETRRRQYNPGRSISWPVMAAARRFPMTATDGHIPRRRRVDGMRMTKRLACLALVLAVLPDSARAQQPPAQRPISALTA